MIRGLGISRVIKLGGFLYHSAARAEATTRSNLASAGGHGSTTAAPRCCRGNYGMGGGRPYGMGGTAVDGPDAVAWRVEEETGAWRMKHYVVHANCMASLVGKQQTFVYV